MHGVQAHHCDYNPERVASGKLINVLSKRNHAGLIPYIYIYIFIYLCNGGGLRGNRVTVNTKAKGGNWLQISILEVGTLTMSSFAAELLAVDEAIAAMSGLM